MERSEIFPKRSKYFNKSTLVVDMYPFRYRVIMEKIKNSKIPFCINIGKENLMGKGRVLYSGCITTNKGTIIAEIGPFVIVLR